MQSVHPPSAAGMTGIVDKLLSQCPVVVTGLLILARAIFESLGLTAPTVTARCTGRPLLHSHAEAVERIQPLFVQPSK
jgi:hypothetical protein